MKKTKLILNYVIYNRVFHIVKNIKDIKLVYNIKIKEKGDFEL